VVRELPNANQFVAYIDAVGELDGTQCLMDWKTTTNRYPAEPAGLLTLDPQLICYSWITGISEVALAVFGCNEVAKFRTLFFRDGSLKVLDFRLMLPDHYRPDRGRSIPVPQRDPFPTERLRKLRQPGALPEQPATD
jgi:hypothetical protein